MDIIFFGNFNKFLKVVFVDTKFAGWASSNDMVGWSCSYFWVYSNKDIFPFEEISVVPESVKCSNVQSNPFLDSIFHLFRSNEVFSVHDVFRLKSTLKSFVNLSGWDNINLFDSKAFDEFDDRNIGVGFEGIFNIKLFRCFEQSLYFIFENCFAVDIERWTVLFYKVFHFLFIADIFGRVFYHRSSAYTK